MSDEISSDIRISDPHIKRVVQEVQRHRNGGTASKTAGQLILERFTQLEPEIKGTDSGKRNRRSA